MHILVAILVRIPVEFQTTSCPSCSKLLLGGDQPWQFLELTIQLRMVPGYAHLFWFYFPITFLGFFFFNIIIGLLATLHHHLWEKEVPFEIGLIGLSVHFFPSIVHGCACQVIFCGLILHYFRSTLGSLKSRWPLGQVALPCPVSIGGGWKWEGLNPHGCLSTYQAICIH